MTPSERRSLLLLIILTLASRIPFLFSGYGAEEDAWALPLVAERIANTGQYEMSRLPGHPVQELLFTLLAGMGPFVYNLCTLVISTLGVFFFARSLHLAGSASWWWGGFMLAFTPLFYLNSTNAMDYTWSLAFMMGSLFFVLRDRMIAAGLLLALATGCRITSLALLFPLLVLILYSADSDSRMKKMLKFSFAAMAGSLVVFSPVYFTYGLSFFNYYQHFPVPGLLKNVYKGTLAVWGLPGLLALLAGLILLLKRKAPLSVFRPELQTALLYASLLAILLFTAAFIKLPLKAAFMLPVLPFAVLLQQVCCTEKQLRLLALMMLFSCFFFGVNLAEAERGSGHSSTAVVLSIQHHEVAIDPLQGLVIADHRKRLNRSRFADRVIEQCTRIKAKSVLICGWWQAELLVRQKTSPTPNIELAHYLDEASIRSRIREGKKVYYLTDQWQYNDERYKGHFTRGLAGVFPLP